MCVCMCACVCVLSVGGLCEAIGGAALIIGTTHTTTNSSGYGSV